MHFIFYYILILLVIVVSVYLTLHFARPSDIEELNEVEEEALTLAQVEKKHLFQIRN